MKTKNRRHSIGGVVLGMVLLALGCSDGVLPSQGGPVTPQLALPACKSFTASPVEVDRGGSVELSWDVELADKLEIAASGDNPFHYETTDQFTGTTPVSNIQETTTFILTAFNSSIIASEEGAQEGEETPPSGMRLSQSKAEEENGEGEEENAAPAPLICRLDVEVRVRAQTQAPTIEQFYAEQEEVSPGQETKLHWTVVPDEAQVSIASSAGDQPVVVPCEAENTAQALAEGEVPESYPASGCASVVVQEDTAYTLTARLGEETADKTISVRVTEEEEPVEPEPEVPVLQVDCSEIQVTAPAAPVFSGEEVEIGWEISGVTASNVTSVRIAMEKTGEVLETVEAAGEQGNHARVAAKSGMTVEFVAADGSVPCSSPATLTVASFDGASGAKAVKVVDDPADSNGAVYVGHDLGGFNAGVVRVTRYPNVDNPLNINFFVPFNAFDSMTEHFNTHFMQTYVQDFPVNAIAKLGNGKLMVATTGVILLEGDLDAEKDEDKWKVVTVFPRADVNGDYPGEHDSCFGNPQHGRDGGVRGDIDTFGQVCDMEAAGNGLYFGTDRGLYHIPDVESFMSGSAPIDWRAQREGNPTYPHVVNDIYVDGSDVYAATSEGVFNFKNGEKILDFVYANSVAVTYGPVDESIFVVGTDSGIYVNDALTLEGNIYSVAVDPYDSRTIYAAGASGFYVSRDGGESFTQVAVEGLEGEVRSVAVLYSTDPREEEAKYYVYLAGDDGVRKAYLEDVVMGEVVEPAEPAEEEAPPAEDGEEADEGAGADDEFHVKGSVGQS